MKTIHEVINDKTELAKIYAEDGAFHTAVRVLRDLAKTIEDHAIACDHPGWVAPKAVSV